MIPFRIISSFNALLLALLLLVSVLAGCKRVNDAKDVRTGASTIANALAIKITSSTQVAVTDFVTLDTNKEHPISKRLSENIITALVNSGNHNISVIERRLIDQAMKELKFQSSDFVDPASIKRFGKFLGVDVVVTGTVDPMDGALNINARGIDVESLNIVGAVQCTILASATPGSQAREHIEIGFKKKFSLGLDFSNTRTYCVELKTSTMQEEICIPETIKLYDAKMSPDQKKIVITGTGKYSAHAAIAHAIFIADIRGINFQAHYVHVPGYSSGDLVSMRNLVFTGDRKFSIYLDSRRARDMQLNNKKLSGAGTYEMTIGEHNAISDFRKIS